MAFGYEIFYVQAIWLFNCHLVEKRKNAEMEIAYLLRKLAFVFSFYLSCCILTFHILQLFSRHMYARQNNSSFEGLNDWLLTEDNLNEFVTSWSREPPLLPAAAACCQSNSEFHHNFESIRNGIAILLFFKSVDWDYSLFKSIIENETIHFLNILYCNRRRAIVESSSSFISTDDLSTQLKLKKPQNLNFLKKKKLEPGGTGNEIFKQIEGAGRGWEGHCGTCHPKQFPRQNMSLYSSKRTELIMCNSSFTPRGP